jgi:dTDP-4-dehydrorhamnose 3,5-epimerase
MLWVPPGLAHGFLTLEDATHFLYKCTAFYDPANEHSLLWDDPELGIEWPLGDMEPVLSEKDRAGRPLANAETFA